MGAVRANMMFIYKEWHKRREEFRVFSSRDPVDGPT